MFQKNIKKYIFDVKFPVISNATGRIGLNIEDRPENGKTPQLLKNSKVNFQLAQTFKFLLIWKCYFPFYKNKFGFSAGSIFFPYSQHVKVPIKTGFEGVPLK